MNSQPPTEEQQSGRTRPWRYLFSGFGFWTIDAVVVWVGSISLRGVTITREDHPIVFWLAVLVIAGLGALWVGLGLSKFRGARNEARRRKPDTVVDSESDQWSLVDELPVLGGARNSRSWWILVAVPFLLSIAILSGLTSWRLALAGALLVSVPALISLTVHRLHCQLWIDDSGSTLSRKSLLFGHVLGEVKRSLDGVVGIRVDSSPSQFTGFPAEFTKNCLLLVRDDGSDEEILKHADDGRLADVSKKLQEHLDRRRGFEDLEVELSASRELSEQSFPG